MTIKPVIICIEPAPPVYELLEKQDPNLYRKVLNNISRMKAYENKLKAYVRCVLESVEYS